MIRYINVTITKEVDRVNSIGKKMKAARRRKGLTQAWMAERLNVHRTTYTKYERGQVELPLSLLRKVTALLDISVEELLDEA